MSRAKAKMAIVHDLQCLMSDFILTKKDCDLISNALYKTYEWKEIEDLYNLFKNLSTHTIFKRK